MASAANMDKLLRCSICMGRFTGSGPMKPKMLPCQHSFCMTCLKSISSGRRIECPLCRAVHQKSLEELPNNFLLLQLVDSARPRPKKEPPKPIFKLRTYFKTPTKVLQALKAYLEERDANFDEEDLSAVLQCLEHYMQPQLQHLDIMMVCMNILAKMSSFPRAFSDDMQRRLQKDTIAVVKLCRSRSEIRYPCIKVLYNLIYFECVDNYYTFESTEILLGLLDGVTQLQREEEMLVELLAILFLELNVEEKERIGNRHNVKLLLQCARSKWGNEPCLLHVLSALVNLTDMASTPCRNTVIGGGLGLLDEILEDENQSTDVTDCAAIILCNVSEVQDLKGAIIKQKSLVETLVSLMESKDHTICVLSAETISNLSALPASEWQTLCGTSDMRTDAVKKLQENVSVWMMRDPKRLLFRTNSLKPLFAMLKTYETPPCQLFAAWRLRNLCTHESPRMQQLVIEEDGLPVLLDIKENVYADKVLRKVVNDILVSISSVL